MVGIVMAKGPGGFRRVTGLRVAHHTQIQDTIFDLVPVTNVVEFSDKPDLNYVGDVLLFDAQLDWLKSYGGFFWLFPDQVHRLQWSFHVGFPETENAVGFKLFLEGHK